MAEIGRGMSPMKEKVWRHMNEKENSMRLKWFYKNQKKLAEIAEQETTRKELSPEILLEVEKMRQERYRKMERFGRKKAPDSQFEDIDPHCILNVMKPVDPVTKKKLYDNMDNRARKTYLHERVKIKPEEKYYFPETAAFVYGWKIMDENRKIDPGHKFGRCQVIKHSFYRRNGALKLEPDYYRLPQRDSPTVCSF